MANSSDTVYVRGRKGSSMTGAADTEDTAVAVPANADTMIIQKPSYKYPIYYSLTGLVDEWCVMSPNDSGNPFNIHIPAGVSTVYIRKPIERRGPSYLDPPPELANYFADERKYGDDIVAVLSIQFVGWK